MNTFWQRHFCQWRLCFFFLLLAGCATLPETGRQVIHLVPAAEMQAMGLQEFTKMKQQIPISKNPTYRAQADRVGRRIAQAVGGDMPGAQWEFVVFDDDQQVNAFALPGGKVGVFTGLLKLVTTDDELAAVMGHEIAHVRLEHGNERMSQSLIATGVGVGLEVALRNKSEQTRQAARTAYGIGSTIGVMLPFSRLHEREADKVGVLYAARAGYDPRASISFWQKMQSQGGSQPPQFLSTHPSHEDRIQRLQAVMPQALQEYERYRVGHVQ